MSSSASGFNIDWPAVAITVLVGLAVVATGAEVVNSYEAGIEPNGEFEEAAQAYCEKELGEDAELYVANVMGGHGGYHCDGPDADGEIIHLHDVPDEEIYATLPEEQNGTQIDFEVYAMLECDEKVTLTLENPAENETFASVNGTGVWRVHGLEEDTEYVVLAETSSGAVSVGSFIFTGEPITETVDTRSWDCVR